MTAYIRNFYSNMYKQYNIQLYVLFLLIINCEIVTIYVSDFKPLCSVMCIDYMHVYDVY